MNSVVNPAAPLPLQPVAGAQPPAPGGLGALASLPSMAPAGLAMAGAALAVQPDSGGGYVQQGGTFQQGLIGGGGPIAPDALVAGASVQQQLIPVLQQIISVLSQIVTSLGGNPAPVTPPAATQGGGAATTVPPPPASAAPVPAAAAAPLAPAGGVSTVAAPAAPAVAAPAMPVVGGGVGVDRRYILGAPAPGGLIEFLIANARTEAPPARSEGAWTQIPDGSGATMQAHVHGRYAQAPHLLGEALQRGEVVVHLHPDGLLHIHDLV